MILHFGNNECGILFIVFHVTRVYSWFSGVFLTYCFLFDFYKLQRGAILMMLPELLRSKMLTLIKNTTSESVVPSMFHLDERAHCKLHFKQGYILFDIFLIIFMFSIQQIFVLWPLINSDIVLV